MQKKAHREQWSSALPPPVTLGSSLPSFPLAHAAVPCDQP